MATHNGREGEHRSGIDAALQISLPVVQSCECAHVEADEHGVDSERAVQCVQHVDAEQTEADNDE